MKQKHLTEREIQNILDGNISLRETENYSHFRECPVCQEKLIFYKTLVKNLNKELDLHFSSTFTERIISKLPLKERKIFISKFLSSEMIFGIMGMLLSIISAVYVFGWRLIADTIGNITLPGISLKTFFYNLEIDIVSMFNCNSRLLILGVITIAAVAVIDYLITAYSKSLFIFRKNIFHTF